MKLNLLVMALAGCLMSTLLSGCYESTEITYHQPGQYKGKTDPLIAKQKNPEQREMLIERFKQVQTDR